MSRSRVPRKIATFALWVAIVGGGWASAEDQPTGHAKQDRVGRLAAARTWMYQIQGLDEPGAVPALERSEYPLLVLEPGHNLRESRTPTTAMLRKLRTTPAGRTRLLLAYIDVGQAEDYRDYWKSDWRAPGKGKPGEPDFLLTVDPDGWSGNYPVAYWRRPWQDLWLGDAGMVATLARLGFDGVYLDWVEAYDDEHVREAAERERVDAPTAMIDFIQRIREAGRAVTPDFLVIPQNAPYLLDTDPERYASVIDALAVEDTWFHGAGDAEWDDPEAGDLRERHEDEWSTRSRLRQLRKYLDRGLPVFSVDYCIAEENAARVYREAREAGLRPLVTRVSLSRMTVTPPDR